ncbi:hypothetical protein U7230_09105 [Carboxydochorda subterranea]|uniref:Uncharacterized protein n=1 Tax=Carboxydichorda subterranea TaxID=3109565 RepID=A0ABZ1BUF9_9FIRM|nr:hypothetical protein [Limnochorda sp. L945t]WRP16260.1 hypothetical protein U7230_09105 [Limnochorda sp. L945t]
MTLQRLIVQYLRTRHASYSHPICSKELSEALGVCWSYARMQARMLVDQGQVAVRRGPGGGYYLPRAHEQPVPKASHEIEGVVAELTDIARQLARACHALRASEAGDERTEPRNVEARLYRIVDTLGRIRDGAG